MAVDRSMQVRLDMLVADYIRHAQSASRATEGIATAAQKPKAAIDRIGEAGRQVGRTLVAAAGVGATAVAAWGASAFAAGAAYNTLQQTANSALTTLLGSAEAATAQMAELSEFARTSPFPRQIWIQAQQTLIGFGVEAERVVPILSALQDGVVAVGGSAQSIQEVVLILSKISSVGKITAEDLNELGVRGIDAATLVGEAWGMTAGEIRESISSGAVDAGEFLDTLVSQLQTRYAGAAEGLRTTWVGAFDRIKGATRDLGSIMAEPFIDPQGGGAAVVWANDVADALRALESVARPAMEVLRSQADPAFTAASEAAQRFAAAISEMDLVAVIDHLSDAAPILTAFGAAAAAAGTSSALGAVGMGSLAGAINPVSAGVITLAAVSPELRTALVDILTSLAPLVPPATDLAVELAELASSGAGLAGSILSLLAPALSVLVTVITPVMQFATGLVTVLDAIPGPVLLAAAGILGLVKVLMMLRTFTGALTIGAALETAFLKTEAGAKRAAASVGGFRMLLKGLAAGVIVAGVVALANAFDDTAEELERIRSVTSAGLVEDLEHLAATGEQTAGLKQLFGEGADAAENFQDKLKILNQDWTDLSWWNTSGNEADAAAESFRTLDSAMTEMVSSGQDADEVLRLVADAYDLNDEEIQHLLDALPQYTAEAERQAAAGHDGADAAEEHADGLAGLEDQANATRVSLKSLADEMRAQTDPVFAAIRATRDLADAQDAYDEAVAEHGQSSDEAREALLDLIEAQSEATSAAGEMAEVTGGEVPEELYALAEAAGISSDELDWLIGQIEDAQSAGEEYANVIADVNADLTESGGIVAARMGLVYRGMTESAANWAVNSKAAIDELMAAGWTYEEALEEVARRSGVSTEFIEDKFEEAREKGLEFSDEYPAHITLTGADDAIGQITRVSDTLSRIDGKTATVYVDTSGAFIPKGMDVAYSTGGPVGGPLGAGDVVPARLTPGEHVWTRAEVDAIGGHGVMEAMRAAALAGQSAYASSSPRSVASPVSVSGPDHFTATAVIDLGEGVRRVMDVRFEAHDRDMKRRVLAGAGRSR